MKRTDAARARRGARGLGAASLLALLLQGTALVPAWAFDGAPNGAVVSTLPDPTTVGTWQWRAPGTDDWQDIPTSAYISPGGSAPGAKFPSGPSYFFGEADVPDAYTGAMAAAGLPYLANNAEDYYFGPDGVPMVYVEDTGTNQDFSLTLASGDPDFDFSSWDRFTGFILFWGWSTGSDGGGAPRWDRDTPLTIAFNRAVDMFYVGLLQPFIVTGPGSRFEDAVAEEGGGFLPNEYTGGYIAVPGTAEELADLRITEFYSAAWDYAEDDSALAIKRVTPQGIYLPADSELRFVPADGYTGAPPALNLLALADGETVEDGTVYIEVDPEAEEFAGSIAMPAFFLRGADVDQDYDRLLLSFAALADQAGVLAEDRIRWLDHALDGLCSPAPGQVACFAATGLADTGGAGASGGMATVAVGRDLAPGLTFSALLGVASGDGADGTGRTWGGRLRWLSDPVAGMGPGASLTLGGSSGDVVLSRGDGFADVQTATGTTAAKSAVAEARMTWGLPWGEGGSVTPFLAAASEKATLTGYAEDAALETPASYDDFEVSRTVVKLGASGERATGPRHRIRLAAEMAWDIDSSAPSLSGTSEIPGLASFDIPVAQEANRMRAEVSMTNIFQIAPQQSISATVSIGSPVYGDSAIVTASASYALSW